jgi:Trehalose utilisation
MKAMRTMKLLCSVVIVVLCALVSPALAQQAFTSGSDDRANVQRAPLWGQNPNGMHVYIRAGLKTHGPGLHDYPQFLADWSKILTDHGAVVDGSLHAPSAAELEHTDVLVIDKGDTGFMTDGEKAALEGFINRGGGIVSIHDALCGPDPAYFATLVGGGKKHGQVNYTLGADIPYTILDRSNPLLQGMSDITIFDEAFYNMTWSKTRRFTCWPPP